MNILKLHTLIREAYEELAFLVEPVVERDIREQRGKLKEAMEILEKFSDA